MITTSNLYHSGIEREKLKSLLIFNFIEHGMYNHGYLLIAIIFDLTTNHDKVDLFKKIQYNYITCYLIEQKLEQIE